MAEIVNLSDKRTERDSLAEGFQNGIAECRECGKLLRVYVEYQPGAMLGGYEIMSSGSPLFGKCPSQRQFPSCGEKYAARLFLVEDFRSDGVGQAVVVHKNGEIELG